VDAMKKRVTIEDVAREAGVSRQTVSRAINAKGEISPETRDRVLQAVEALGYRPSSLARGLATRRSLNIGLVVPDITNPFFPEIARGVEDVGRAVGYSVFLCNTDENPEQETEVLISLASQPVDGIVLCGSRTSNEQLADFVDTYQPLVLMNRQFEHPNVGLVLVNNAKGIGLAVDHLVAHGHSCVGLLAGPARSPSSEQRVVSYEDRIREHGLCSLGCRIVRGAPTLEGGYEAAEELFRAAPDVTGIVCYNDLVALGAVKWCRDQGRRVPDDCAIIGFDDIRLASLVHPALTSIRVDKYGLGRVAMERLLEMFADPDTVCSPVVLDVELVVREST
jgi:LacI family transcriptional regulator